MVGCANPTRRKVPAYYNAETKTVEIIIDDPDIDPATIHVNVRRNIDLPSGLYKPGKTYR
jgi:hypothetical protein